MSSYANAREQRSKEAPAQKQGSYAPDGSGHNSQRATTAAKYLQNQVIFYSKIGGLPVYVKTIPSFLATNLHFPDEYALPFVS